MKNVLLIAGKEQIDAGWVVEIPAVRTHCLQLDHISHNPGAPAIVSNNRTSRVGVGLAVGEGSFEAEWAVVRRGVPDLYGLTEGGRKQAKNDQNSLHGGSLLDQRNPVLGRLHTFRRRK